MTAAAAGQFMFHFQLRPPQ